MSRGRTVLVNGLIVLQKEVVQNYAIIINEKKIEDIVPLTSIPREKGSFKIIDCSE